MQEEMTPVKVVELSDEDNKRLGKLYKAHQELGMRYIRTEPGNQILAYTFDKYKDQFSNFAVRSDDVFVFGWPKNGSVWLAEMAWCIRNNFDLEKARSVDFFHRFPFIDFAFMAEAAKHVLPTEGFTQIVSSTEKMPSPRTIRSHLSFDLMPQNMTKDAKVLVALRNPKDTIVSYYHHERLIKLFSFCGSFREYFDIFMDGLVAWGCYWEYTKEVWKRRNDPNVLIVFYEDMKKDLGGCIKKVAKFLEADVSEEQVEQLKKHLSFESMKDNPAVNLEHLRPFGYNNIEGGRFMRKGEVGDWKNYFDEDMNRCIDKAVKEHFEGIGLSFVYE